MILCAGRARKEKAAVSRRCSQCNFSRLASRATQISLILTPPVTLYIEQQKISTSAALRRPCEARWRRGDYLRAALLSEDLSSESPGEPDN